MLLARGCKREGVVWTWSNIKLRNANLSTSYQNHAVEFGDHRGDAGRRARTYQCGNRQHRAR